MKEGFQIPGDETGETRVSSGPERDKGRPRFVI